MTGTAARLKVTAKLQRNLAADRLDRRDLTLAATARLRSDADLPGFCGDCQPNEDDARQLLKTGWTPPKFTRYGLCPACDGVMEIGDESPEERICMTCAAIG